MSSKIVRAISLASRYHYGQKYGDKDYFIYHLTGVANSLETLGFNEDYIITGYLHDIIEDTECTEKEVLDLFGQEVLDAVIALTKRYYGLETHADYLKRVSQNEMARVVKIHDSTFNMLNCVKEKNYSMVNKYLNNIRVLS